MILPPFDSSRYGDSDGGKIIQIQSLERALISIIVKHLYYRCSFNINARKLILPPLDSSHQDDLNGGKIIQIQSLERTPISIIVKHL